MTVAFSSVALYQTLGTVIPKREALYAKNAQVKNDVEYFKDKIKDITTVDEFFEDYRLLEISLKAYGLESEISKLGYIKRVLTSNPFDDTSLVNIVADNRYREMATDLLLSSGIGLLKTDSTAQSIEEKLISAGVEKELDQQSPGIRAAIHFKKAADAGDITSPFNILGNPVLRDVALDASGLPLEIVLQNVEAQGRTLERFFDFDRFDDPTYVDRVIKRYLVSTDLDNANTGGPISPLAGLFGSTPTVNDFGIGPIDILI